MGLHRHFSPKFRYVLGEHHGGGRGQQPHKHSAKGRGTLDGLSSLPVLVHTTFFCTNVHPLPVVCGDGRTQLVRFKLAKVVSDRLELEALNDVPQWTCYACMMPRLQRVDAHTLSCPITMRTQQDVCDQVRCTCAVRCRMCVVSVPWCHAHLTAIDHCRRVTLPICI